MCKETVYKVFNSVMEKIKSKENKKAEGEHADIAEMGNPQPEVEPLEGQVGYPR